jgi:cell division protein FtsI (penicillin-binding protein 3)/stage V sporulation protein D (sporulation-specific penicillin-binding protein)
MKSSNIGSAKMALMLGDEKFYEYIRRFGFGQRTGVDLPGEIPGLVHPPSQWDKLTITRMPMGQSVAVTPLQIVMAMSVIANGGNLMRPHIIRSIKNEDGKTIHEFAPEVVRRVIPEKTAQLVNSALVDVVGDRGTAALARVNGYTVAGKTGTAQKADPRGGYAPNKYVVSFVGYMPAEDPQFVCLIMVNDAKISSNLNYGGLVAAPVFSRVAEKAARYLDLTPALVKGRGSHPLPAEAILPVAMQKTDPEEMRQ